MILLPNEIIKYIVDFLSLKDKINFLQTNKETYYLLDNNYFEKLAYKIYSINFWITAILRNPEYSKPLKNYKQELLRLENFQNKLSKFNFEKWSEKDFLFIGIY